MTEDTPHPAPVKILLVEDDDADAKAVRRAFKSARISNEIVRVTDGIAALEVLRTTTADALTEPFILLVDINMPRMNGHEFVSELRSDPKLSRLIVFILTTSNAHYDLKTAYQNNVAGYIVKEDAGRDFLRLADTLACYWRLIELPVGD
ncbi:response regulator [Phaeobacter sp. B1627]|uniref:response regulator n=1 Tax=Phaeobacter sp. B1627 TaxID=2583809 RepID=UPI001119B55C|nr:response regulator [Phaeobacter sp. B1627]TNJ46301.1 response regulator [Phaeobacter sp. B1627]